MLRRAFLTILALCLLNQINAQPPSGYYNSASGLTGKTLQKALHDIIDNHTVKTYDYLWTAFQTTDTKAGGTIVWDIYSDVPGGTPAYTYTISSDQCGNYAKEGDCYNREHSFPKSWFNDASPMYTDLFHLYPTDGYVNGKRSNYPFGEVSSADWTSTNGSKLGTCSWPGYSGTVFEPIDEYKGDFARTYFYMATRYYGEDSSWPGSDMVNGSQPKTWALNMLLAWHRADPVSTKETNRNNEVYQIQNNRNPFIDDPLYAEKIWGTLNATDDLRDDDLHVVVYPNPASVIITIRQTGITCQNAEVYLLDMTGCTVMVSTSEGENTTIDVSRLQPGIYFVSITCGQKVFATSFVKSGK